MTLLKSSDVPGDGWSIETVASYVLDVRHALDTSRSWLENIQICASYFSLVSEVAKWRN